MRNSECGIKLVIIIQSAVFAEKIELDFLAKQNETLAELIK